MPIEILLGKIKNTPEQLIFSDVITLIEGHYHYLPTSFTNGVGANALVNEAGTNQGSCKAFAFAQIHGLNEQETLACFGEHYRAVLADPSGSSHANIRRFMRDGWRGIIFSHCPLKVRGQLEI